MTMTNPLVTIFGGTGFVGRHVVRRLADAGYTVKVATRCPESAYFLRPCGKVGQIVPFPCNYHDESSIAAAVKGSQMVVNCIGILYERRKSRFEQAHVTIPRHIAQACKNGGVARLVHISALSADKSASKYARTKKQGEDAIRASFPAATILRPSVVFGPEDNFFNKFARLSMLAPALPLFGGGKTKFQPVYVGDVAAAVMAALTLPAFGAQNPQGKTYELGGPEIVTLKEIFQRLFAITERRRLLVPLPWSLSKLKALFLGLLPNPVITMDQVESLKTDTVVAPDALSFANLQLVPTGMSLILPSYLGFFRRGGLFPDHKEA